eukprot:scaffold198942_cov19-Tisochrysis_lutea.AAC.1
MIDRVFGPSALFLVDKLKTPSKTGAPVNMEAAFSQLTLDVIGKVGYKCTRGYTAATATPPASK